MSICIIVQMGLGMERERLNRMNGNKREFKWVNEIKESGRVYFQISNWGKLSLTTQNSVWGELIARVI